MNARRLVSMLALAAVAGLLVSGCSSSSTTTTGVSASTAKLSVSDVEPLLGSIDGGTSLTITGQGFVDGAQVTLGPVVATDVVVGMVKSALLPVVGLMSGLPGENDCPAGNAKFRKYVPGVTSENT